jgi:hypothetical protein
MAKPEIVNSPENEIRLEERIESMMEQAEKHENAYAEGLVRFVIQRAAEFFAYCPDDFCFATGEWYDGHVVFGGTNRLHWSVQNGFWPSKEHCTPRFLKQFEGEVWEPIGFVAEADENPYLTIMGNAGNAVIVHTAWGNPHHTILGRKGKDGRIAEVRILTGTEA